MGWWVLVTMDSMWTNHFCQRCSPNLNPKIKWSIWPDFPGLFQVGLAGDVKITDLVQGTLSENYFKNPNSIGDYKWEIWDTQVARPKGTSSQIAAQRLVRLSHKLCTTHSSNKNKMKIRNLLISWTCQYFWGRILQMLGYLKHPFHS